MTPLIYTQHFLHGYQFIARNIFSSWPLIPLSVCVYIEGNVPLSKLSVCSLLRQTPWHFLEKYAAKATARESALVPGMCFCLRVCLCVCHCLLSPLLSLARQWPFTTKCHSGQYVRKTFGMKEGRMAAEKEKETTASAWTAWEQKGQWVE